MNKTRFVFSIAVAALLVATPAMGQLNNFPVLALPAGDADGATSIGAGWGRGLNESTGKLNSFVLGVARAMESVSFGISGAYVVDAGGADASEIALGGSIAYNLPQNDLPVRFGVQGGIEWMSMDGTPDNTTLLNFPVGITIQGSTQAGSMALRPWIMGRWEWIRTSSGGTSGTEGNAGISSGISGVMESGFGIGLSIDWTRPDRLSGAATENWWLFGAAVFYALP